MLLIFVIVRRKLQSTQITLYKQGHRDAVALLKETTTTSPKRAICVKKRFILHPPGAETITGGSFTNHLIKTETTKVKPQVEHLQPVSVTTDDKERLVDTEWDW
ncbi:hypothetical protein QE152_g19070 [Popillia japonica]|uniref:Uncharacterized protein n=1 Tax=Popillia japonica TaxID=7064 RepID=A0AAW1L2B2_POPJA